MSDSCPTGRFIEKQLHAVENFPRRVVDDGVKPGVSAQDKRLTAHPHCISAFP
jgi:hypothetical protein